MHCENSQSTKLRDRRYKPKYGNEILITCLDYEREKIAYLDLQRYKSDY